MKRYNVPRLAVGNKLDRQGSNPDEAIGQLRDQLKLNASPVQLPIGLEGNHEGVIDLISKTAYRFSGDRGQVVEESTTLLDDMQAMVEEKRQELVEH